MGKVSEQRFSPCPGVECIISIQRPPRTDWEILSCHIRAMGWGGEGAANRDGFGRQRLSWLEVLVFSLLLASNIGDSWS